MERLFVFAFVGLLAQVIDGSLGMAYGVTASTLLLANNVAPAVASASVHLAEVGTTAVSGFSHWRFGNVEWGVVARLAVPGAIGAFLGASVLSNLSTESATPWVAVLLLLLGVYIVARFVFGKKPVVVTRRPGTRFLAPLGLFVYMAFLHYWMGDALAFSHVQRAWGRQIANPAVYLWRGLTSWPDGGHWITPSQILALAATSGLILTGVLAWRRQWPAVVFALLCILIPLAAGLASMLRFMTGMAPLTITLMTILGRSRIIFVLSLVTLLTGAWFTTLAWLGGNIALV